MNRKIKIGLDFDGVVAYNPFRVVRAPWAFFKRRVLGIKKLTFFYPQTAFQRFIWKLMHDSSVYPAKGAGLLKELIEDNLVEAHLISGRFSFLNDHLYRWLDSYKMRHLFISINWNKQDKQPHIFKEEIIRKLGIEIYIEDNWDIVEYLNKKSRLRQGYGGQAKLRVYWIYNILDRWKGYQYKFPYLEKALEEIMQR